MAENKETKMSDTQQQQQEQQGRKSLYVGDLDPTVNAIDLYIAFSKVCSVANVRICYDCWGHSLCYGYVNFFSPSEAAKAMSKLNHTNLKGKPMRIMWCERNPITRKTGKANLFVKNLDTSIDSARLDSIFSKFGTVLSCKVAEDDNGKSKGFGFVQFEQEESAMKALNSLHDTELEGKKLYVNYFMKRNQRHQNFTNLYVKSLKLEVSEDDLKKKFSEYGKVNSVAIMRDFIGFSKGYGFVSFESPDDAKKAMEALNGTSDLGCDSLFVGRAQKKAEREKMIKESLEKRKSCSVHVTNLGPDVDEGMLKSHFSVFGEVVQAKVLRYPNAKCACVTFASPAEAKAAASSLFGLSSIHKPLYGPKVEGEQSCPISAKHSVPSNSAAGNMHFNSLSRSDKGLNFPTADEIASATAANINNKVFPGKSAVPPCTSTASSSRGINLRRCKDLHVVVPKAQVKGGARTPAMKMNVKEPDLFKQSGDSNVLLQQIRERIQVVLDSKGRCLNTSSPFKPLNPEVV